MFERARDWIKKNYPMVVIVAIAVATVIFIVWLYYIPLYTPQA